MQSSGGHPSHLALRSRVRLICYPPSLLARVIQSKIKKQEWIDMRSHRHTVVVYMQEAQQMLEKRLPVPAYDHLLKLSHTFNLLDARGAVGMSERADCFATMRNLARQVTGALTSLFNASELLHAYIAS